MDYIHPIFGNEADNFMEDFLAFACGPFWLLRLAPSIHSPRHNSSYYVRQRRFGCFLRKWHLPRGIE